MVGRCRSIIIVGSGTPSSRKYFLGRSRHGFLVLAESLGQGSRAPPELSHVPRLLPLAIPPPLA